VTAEVLVLDTVRTPVGRHGGALAGTRPDDLAAHVLRELLARRPNLDPAAVDDVIFGNGNGAGEENRDVARMAALLAGLPTSVPGVTVNRLCGSGLEAVIQAGRAITVGEASLVIAGGVESMSRAPWVLPKPERPYAKGDATLASTTLGWRLVNPAMPAEWTVSLGEGAEILAEKFGIDRGRQDAFAVRSHRLAHQAWERGVLAEEVASVPGTGLERDEGIRPDTTTERLAALKSSFREGGRSRPATPPSSATAPPPCWSATGAPPTPSASSRWPASPPRPCMPWSPSCTASRRWRRPTVCWPGPGSAGRTCRWWS
jgi:acetyl-CoA acetyltransferase family protein